MRNKERQGAAAVEFAVAVMIVLIFVFGVIEFGRIRMVQHTLDTASYEAARHVVVPGATANEAITIAQDILAAGQVSGATITVTPNPLDDNATRIRVHVTAPLDANAWIAPRFTQGRTVSAETELMTERAPGMLVGTMPKRPSTGGGGGGGGGSTTGGGGGGSGGGSTGGGGGTATL